MIHLASRRGRSASSSISGAHVIDVTSRGPAPWSRFSPFFPHGGVPVPFTPGETAASVEGLWQGLKVFEHEDVAPGVVQSTKGKGLKRPSGGARGEVLGHRAGLRGDRLLSYLDARRTIYLPAYRFVLEHHLAAEVAELRALAARSPVVLLDFETNADVDDPSRPLSHAALVACHVEGIFPGDAPSRPPAPDEPDPLAELERSLETWGAAAPAWVARLAGDGRSALQNAWDWSRDPAAMLAILARARLPGFRVRERGDRWTETSVEIVEAPDGTKLTCVHDHRVGGEAHYAIELGRRAREPIDAARFVDEIRRRVDALPTLRSLEVRAR